MAIASLIVLFLHTSIAVAFTNPIRCSYNRQSLIKVQSDINILASDERTDDDHDRSEQVNRPPKPQWMKCINAVVPPNVRALNEAVAIVANVSREEATKLIEIGAVWAKMNLLTEDDVIDQYYETSSSAAIQYGDLPSGWGSGDYGLGSSDDEEEMSLDEYIERQMSLRYRRILTPSTIDPGTDIRIYPHPRRFPSCYDFADPNRLLYEDTTFIVVDKPPMLPTQPEPSNYEECCPGCVNLLMGPFKTVSGEDVARPLICHRVDSCVGGCLVLSKDGNGQRVFSQLQVR
jgi:23S rRNA-/tRNA-specific pseudouridylate synthase